jgi:transmembrane sensor
MMTTDREADFKAAARDWLLRFSLESPTSADRARFEAWRAEDPRHGEAYQRFESIWQDAATLTDLARLVPLPAAPDRWPRRALYALRARPSIWAAGAAIAGAIGAFAVWMLMPPTHFATGVAEVREIRLTDGSEVTLGARTSIDVDFRYDERRVIMSEGEAFFSVSKNPARAFVVVVGNKEVRVVGTKFEVRRRDAGVRVSVVEGTVEVMQSPAPSPTVSVTTLSRSARSHADAAHPTVTLSDGASATLPDAQVREQPEERVLIAGQQVTAATAGPIPDPQLMPRGEEPAAWRHGRLVYVDAPLREVVADANRYSQESIAIGDERIADLRVSVTYPSNRIEEMLSALSRCLSIDIERPAAGKIVLTSKDQSE